MQSVDRIREALRNGRVVLERGQLRATGDQPERHERPERPTRPTRGRQRVVDEDEELDDDRASTIRLKPTTWAADDPQWHRKPWFRKRLDAEVDLMLQQFDQARLLELPDGKLGWQFVVRSISATPYTAALVYPLTFPSGEMEAYITKPRLQPAPHYYTDGRLCLGHAYATNTSAVTAAAWVAAWVSAYEMWRQDGVWPEFNNLA